MRNVSAYYHWPTLWLGKPPAPGGNIDFEEVSEEVHTETLTRGVKVMALKEGMFMFDFSEWQPGRAPPENLSADFDAVAPIVLKRTSLMNAHLACLHTSISRPDIDDSRFVLYKMVVSPSDLIWCDSLSQFTYCNADDPRVTWLMETRWIWHGHGYYNTMDPRLMRRRVVDSEKVAESFSLLDEILSNPDQNAMFLVELCLRSCKACEDHNYALSLVTAWALVENLLQRLWSRYIDDQRDRQVEDGEVFLNSARREKLTYGRDFTASVISEFLSLADIIPFELFQVLSKVRKARNDWMHELRPVTRLDANEAVGLAQRMLNFVDKLDFAILPVGRISA